MTALLGRGRAQRSAAGGAAAEEQEARRVEILALGHHSASTPAGHTDVGSSRIPDRFPSHEPAVPGFLPADPGRTGGARTGTPRGGRAAERRRATPAGGGSTPMRADTDRPPAAAPAGIDVEALRRSLIDDLMHRVRTDFERGG